MNSGFLHYEMNTTVKTQAVDRSTIQFRTLRAIMAVQVVEFSNGVYKIRKIFFIKIDIPNGNY